MCHHVSLPGVWMVHLTAENLQDIYIYGYGSIAISTIFRVMNIHFNPAILRWTKKGYYWFWPIMIPKHPSLSQTICDIENGPVEMSVENSPFIAWWIFPVRYVSLYPFIAVNLSSSLCQSLPFRVSKKMLGLENPKGRWLGPYSGNYLDFILYILDIIIYI